MGAVGAFLFEFGKAILFGAAAGASGAYVLAVNLARIGLVALGAKAFSPKVDLPEFAQAKRLTVRDPIAPQQFIYGEDQVSGPMSFANVAGNENRDILISVLLAGHEIDSVTEYRIDSTDVALSDLSGSEDGNVTGGKYDSVARVDLRKGTTTQTVVTNLSTTFPSLFNTAHKGRGWAYMVWDFSLVEGNEDVFKTQPQNLRATIRGKKIYDPRLDSTNGGSGSHRLADDTTWEWSSNPAIILADFLRDDKFGLREEDDRIDWDLVRAAADVCDEQVDIPPVASPANTQNRYTCNGTFLATEPRREVVNQILNSMLGRLVFSQGVWKMWAGEAVSADVTLTEANLAGGITVQASSPSQERYNRVRGSFIDPSRDYAASNYVEQRSATYESEDGGEVRELVSDFPLTHSEYEAQRKAIILLKQSRQQRVVVFEGNYSCFRIQPGATVSITIDELGFAGEKFFVSEWRMSDTGVQLTLVEEIDSAWADPLVADYSTRSATGALVFGETGVPAPTTLTATNIPGGVRLSWTNPIESAYSHIEVWRADENVRGSAVLIGTTQGDEFYDTNPDLQGIRYYWIRAVDSLGRVSAWEPNLTTTTAQSYPETQIVTLVPDPFIRLGASFWDVSDGSHNYRTGEGTNNTDAISMFNPGAGGGTEYLMAAKRRGPDIWDVESPGRFTITVNYRISMRTKPSATFFSYTLTPAITITDEGSPDNAARYAAVYADVNKIFTEADSVDVWYDESVTISVDDSANNDRPRYIQVGFSALGTLVGGEWRVDIVDAVIGPQVFQSAGKVGLVPDATSATPSTDFLRADGTWAVPGGVGGSLPTITQDGAMLRADTSTSPDSWVEETQLRFLSNGFRVYDATEVDYFEVDHAGAVCNITFVGTTQGVFTGVSSFYSFDQEVRVTGGDGFSTEGAGGDRWTISGAQTDTLRITLGGSGGNELTIVSDGADYTNTQLNLGGHVFDGDDIDNWTRSDQAQIIDAPAGWEFQTQIEISGGAPGLLLNNVNLVHQNFGGASSYTMRWTSTRWEMVRTGSGTETSIRFDPATHFEIEAPSSGSALRVGQLSTLDHGDFYHDGTDFNQDYNNTTDLNFRGLTRIRLIDGGVIKLVERASAPSDTAGEGQFWVRNDAPNTPMFTTDTGVDIDLSLNTGIESVLEDTSPQLGGNLDANGFNVDFDDGEGVRWGNAQDITSQWTGTQFNLDGPTDWAFEIQSDVAMQLIGDGKLTIGSAGRSSIAHLNLFGISDPVSPAEGDVWHDSVNDTLKLYSGGGTIDLGAGADLTANETVTGTWTFEGTPVVIEGDGLALELRPDSGGTSPQIYMSFEDTTGATQFGRVGKLSSADDISLEATTGNVRLEADAAAGSVVMSVSSTGIIDMQGEVVIGDGASAELHIEGAITTEYLRLYHDGTAGWVSTAGGSGGDLYLGSQGGRVQVRGGAALRVNNTGNTDYADFVHDGTDFDITFTNTVDMEIGDGLSGGVYLYANNAIEFYTQDHNATDNITGAMVKHWDGSLYDVGLARMPKVNFSSNTTVSDTHWHKRLVHNGTAGATLQLTFNTEASQPQDVVLWVLARNGPVTLVDGSMTLEHFDGGGSAPSTGNITVARGGWATVVKDGDSLAHVTGVGLS